MVGGDFNLIMISQLGLMISDKQEGNFRLEVQRIALYLNEYFQT